MATSVKTEIAEEKQGVAIARTLSGKALDAILLLDDKQINCKDGVKNVMAKLDALYLKNSLTKKIEDIESFENIRRKDTSSVKEFIVDFERCCPNSKLTRLCTPVMSGGIN